MATLDERDYFSIGCAIVALNDLENMLVRLMACDYDVERIRNGSYTQQALQNAVKASYSELLKSLKSKLDVHKNKDNEAQQIIDMLLTESVDSYGRKVQSPLDRWRNTLHHGRFTKTCDGGIYVSFHHRNSFTPFASNPALVSGDLNQKTTASELVQLAESVRSACREVIKIFNIDTIECDGQLRIAGHLLD